MPSLPLVPKTSVIVVPLYCSNTLPCSDSLVCSENIGGLSFVVSSTVATCFTVRLTTSTLRSTDTLRAPAVVSTGLTLTPRSPGSLPLTPR